MKVLFNMRTADYTQELAIQKDNRLSATQEDLDYHTVVMVLGNTCTSPAVITVSEDKDDFVSVIIESDTDEFIEIAAHYCEARGLSEPKIED